MNDVTEQDSTDQDLPEQDLPDQTQPDPLVFDVDLDAPPQKVWRALSIAAFRDKWLPKASLASSEPVRSVPGEEIGYRMRDDEPPFLHSIVTFQLNPNADGGTRLRIIHRLADPRTRLALPKVANNKAANSNGRCLMRAA